jgi:hypothetical protein
MPASLAPDETGCPETKPLAAVLEGAIPRETKSVRPPPLELVGDEVTSLWPCVRLLCCFASDINSLSNRIIYEHLSQLWHLLGP